MNRCLKLSGWFEIQNSLKQLRSRLAIYESLYFTMLDDEQSTNH